MAATSGVDDTAAITATVNKYIDGIAESRPELLLEAFHPQASLSGYFRGAFSITTEGAGERIANFMRTIPPTKEHSPEFAGRIVRIVQHGTMAAVEIAEDGLQGKDMKTFFQLHQVDGRWLITAKATWTPA